MGKTATASGLLKEKRQPNTRMKPNHARRRTGGFTGWDLLVCVVTAVLFSGFVFQWLTRPKARVCRIGCVSQLKQIGLGFRMWSNDNGEQFPWQVSTNIGGTRERISSGEAFLHFSAISNEVNTPKVFVCAYDLPSRTRVANWDQFINDTNVSYFIGLDASEVFPQTILSGDRNLSTSSKLLSGLVLMMSNAPMTWAVGLHAPVGNIGFADGSAAQMCATSAQAQRAMDTNLATRFVFP
jgi:hypothetical protein